MKKVILLRYGEIHLKGRNRGYFENLLLNNIKVKLPNIKTQEKCEKVLEKTEAKVKLEKRKFKNLSQLKKSLLQQMFI